VDRVSEWMGRPWAEIRGLELISEPVPVWAAVVVDHAHDKLCCKYL
jgi:hypothetical protein